MHWYVRDLSCKPNIYVSWSTSVLRVRLAPLNRFKPSSKIFYWPFQGGTSFVDLLCFCSVLCLLCLCASLFICALWSPAGKGLTSWLSFVVSAVSLSLSHWYPGSGVVLDCIDSWSLHPYLLWLIFKWQMLLTRLFNGIHMLHTKLSFTILQQLIACTPGQSSVNLGPSLMFGEIESRNV